MTDDRPVLILSQEEDVFWRGIVVEFGKDHGSARDFLLVPHTHAQSTG